MAGIRQALHNRVTWVALGWFLLAARPAAGQEPPVWKIGPALRQQLDELAGISWDDRPLREGLSRLSQVDGVAIFLDRRIDPDQAVSLTVRDQPLEAVLQQAAAKAHAKVAILGPVIYVGPPASAAQLATLAALRRQEVAQLPNEIKSRLLRVDAWQWPELAQPRDLLMELARQAGLQVANSDRLPLDLWPAVSLPPLAWTDRLTLLLTGFGLTFQIEQQNTVRLVPVPTTVVVEKHYVPRGNAASLAAQLKRILPDATIRVEQGQLVVAGQQEDHDKVDRLLSGQSVRPAKPANAGGEKLYTLQVSNEPAGKVARKVADSLGKELKYDATVLARLKQPVKFSLENATLDHLLETTLQPLGLTYRLTDQTLEIVDRK